MIGRVDGTAGDLAVRRDGEEALGGRSAAGARNRRVGGRVGEHAHEEAAIGHPDAAGARDRAIELAAIVDVPEAALTADFQEQPGGVAEVDHLTAAGASAP